jgi:uncharacterized protein YqgV (UPF0045/DUF77 family)
MRNEILKKIQNEGLAILKLHDKLNELKIDHEFFDRKEEQIKRIKEKKAIDVINEVCPFDYQIYIEENGNKISLIQSPYSYGIMENLIEAYNFQDEPIVLHVEAAAELIHKKKLNRFIKIIKAKNTDDLEKLKEILQSLKEDKK